MIIFNEERSAYYKAKKREIARRKEALNVIRQDALFIRYYGMDAYIKLVPDVIYYSEGWHNEIIKELQRIDKVQLANLLSGIYLASAATRSKKSNRKFIRTIKGMFAKE